VHQVLRKHTVQHNHTRLPRLVRSQYPGIRDHGDLSVPEPAHNVKFHVRVPLSGVTAMVNQWKTALQEVVNKQFHNHTSQGSASTIYVYICVVYIDL
jgi:hypothetical protein